MHVRRRYSSASLRKKWLSDAFEQLEFRLSFACSLIFVKTLWECVWAPGSGLPCRKILVITALSKYRKIILRNTLHVWRIKLKRTGCLTRNTTFAARHPNYSRHPSGILQRRAIWLIKFLTFAPASAHQQKGREKSRQKGGGKKNCAREERPKDNNWPVLIDQHHSREPLKHKSWSLGCGPSESFERS